MQRVLMFILSIIIPASPVYSMTMDEAVSHALKNNPELQALRLEEETAKGQLEKARLLLINNPVIEGNILKKGKSAEQGIPEYTDYGFKLSQEFEIAGQRGLRSDIAGKELSRIGLEIKDKERTLTAEVKDAFVRALALKRKVELTKEIVKLQEDLVGFTKIKFQVGEVSGLEVNLSEVELSKAKKELLSAQREYREALLAFQGIIGIKPDMALNVEGDLPSEKPVLPDKETLKSLAYAQRPDLKIASLEVEKTQSAIRLVNREAVPNITLSGFYDRDEQRNVVGIGLSIPLPFFDRKQAEKREALSKSGQAKIRAEGLNKTVEREFEQANSDLTAASEEISLFKKEILSKAAENLNLLNLAYKEGKIGFFEVRLAQKETIEAQFAYIDAQLRAQIAINTIEKVTGGTLK